MSFVRLTRIYTAHPRGIQPARCHSFTTIQTEKPYYITTPLFYPSDVPHIRHLYSLVVADIFARFQRLQAPERPVHFLTGTDEHGRRVQRAAEANDMRPDAFCDERSERFRLLAERAEVSDTCFMRTTSREHRDTVVDIWRRLEAKGLIYKGEYLGNYSKANQCFHPREVLLGFKLWPWWPSASRDWNSGVHRETGSVTSLEKEQNYFFRLSAFRERLFAYYTSPANAGLIHPPHHHAWVVEMLQKRWRRQPDLSISRPRTRHEWGIPVPGDSEQIIYVWFDALLAYLTGCGFPWNGNGRREGWPIDLQIIGKDILRYHTLHLPAILLALDLPLPRRLLVHPHWTVKQRKMSKSLGNVVDPFEAIQEHGIDLVRYYLARAGGRFRDDAAWSQDLIERHRKEIGSVLGNFFMRVTSSTIQQRMAGAPRLSLDALVGGRNAALIQAQHELPGRVSRCLDNLEVSEAIGCIIDVLGLANKTITDIAPWHPSTPPAVTYASYRVSLETIRVAGICLQPFIPGVAGRLLDALGVTIEERTWRHAGELGGGRLEDEMGAVKGVRLF